MFCKFCNKNSDAVLCKKCLHREEGRVQFQNKRSKKYNCGILSTNDWIEVLVKNNFNCSCCKEHKLFFTLDHIKSMSSGGLNNKENIQPLCSKCHDYKSLIETKKKGNKKKRLEAEFLENY